MVARSLRTHTDLESLTELTTTPGGTRLGFLQGPCPGESGGDGQIREAVR